jgi:hypothetical protein
MCAAAIESDIARLLPLIRFWPRTFMDSDAAKKWVMNNCLNNGFVFSPFRDVEEGKFKGYVQFNTARRAWERGLFDLDTVDEGWKRKTAPCPVPKTVIFGPVEPKEKMSLHGTPPSHMSTFTPRTNTRQRPSNTTPTASPFSSPPSRPSLPI